MEIPDHVEAHPTKRFFVEMLIRDIELAPAIIDLLDNSVDGAKRLRKESKAKNAEARAKANASRFKGLEVRLDVGPTGFAIEDNCGGIDPGIARDYAFRFGRDDDGQKAAVGEIGQFGVGMKRALFKVGGHFKVDSASAGGRFRVEVNVPDWVADKDNWTFPMTALAADEHPLGQGTRISVSNLHPSVKADFGLATFASRLKAQIEMRHAIAMEQGLAIYLAGSKLVPRAPTLLLGNDIQPIVKRETISVNGGDVKLELYAGFVTLRDEPADTDDPEQFKGGSSENAGWYLFCNDRMLIWANQSRLTGWGEEAPRYHPQFRRFRGYVLLNGEAKYMPWNTAKTQVDEDSAVWRSTRAAMVDALREAIKAMNRLKREVEQRPIDDRPLARALTEAKPVRLSALPISPGLSVPAPPKKITAATTTIRYVVPTEDFGQVSAALGTDEAPSVGRATFDYYVRREVDG